MIVVDCWLGAESPERRAERKAFLFLTTGDLESGGRRDEDGRMRGRVGEGAMLAESGEPDVHRAPRPAPHIWRQSGYLLE